MLVPRHKVFVSYHHALDQGYKNEFCRKLGHDFVDRSVEDGDIDPTLKTQGVRQKIRDEFIADATVTVVLVGRCTWKRKHVDWEIGASLRETKANPRCGLLGILLPSHYDYARRQCRLNLIPPRLADNCIGPASFGLIQKWPPTWSSELVGMWIHQAFKRRRSMNPNNSRSQFRHNRSGLCHEGWVD